MTDDHSLHFEKEGIVSVWYSTTPYAEIPDSYFEEDENGLCQWANNYKISTYNHDNLETNGAETGKITVQQAVGECSYSQSYCDLVIHKINKIGDNEITWVILLFDYEYRPKKTKIHKDNYVHFVGAYPYDIESGNVYNL